MKILQKKNLEKNRCYIPVNTSKSPTLPTMRFNYVGFLQDKQKEEALKAKYKQFQQDCSKEAIEQKIEIEKEKFIRLSKLIYVLTMILPTYVGSLEEVIQSLEFFGLRRENLGDLYDAIKLFAEASDKYAKGEKHLFKVWKYNQKSGSQNKLSKDINNEADEFICNAYNNITDILENALRVTTDGKFKKNFNYVALIPQNKLNALAQWWWSNFKEKFDVF